MLRCTFKNFTISQVFSLSAMDLNIYARNFNKIVNFVQTDQLSRYPSPYSRHKASCVELRDKTIQLQTKLSKGVEHMDRGFNQLIHDDKNIPV